MITHIKKYALWYILGILAATYVIVSLVKKEWNPINWFSATGNNTSRRIGFCRNPDGSLGTGTADSKGDCINNAASRIVKNLFDQYDNTLSRQPDANTRVDQGVLTGLDNERRSINDQLSKYGIELTYSRVGQPNTLPSNAKLTLCCCTSKSGLGGLLGFKRCCYGNPSCGYCTCGG